MKAIMEITTDSGGLCKTSHSPYSQYRISTPFGILYYALKTALVLGVSTNLGVSTYGIVWCEMLNLWKRKNREINTPMSEHEKCSSGGFFNLDR